MAEIDGFYPITIRESRYAGSYSGGQWVLMAGCYSPGRTDAFGSDIPCNEFWNDVQRNGPIVEIERPQGPKEVYVASGDDPTELVEEAKEYLSDE